eukprot:5863053-Alexandrium_andersonii.AAC.1
MLADVGSGGWGSLRGAPRRSLLQAPLRARRGRLQMWALVDGAPSEEPPAGVSCKRLRHLNGRSGDFKHAFTSPLGPKALQAIPSNLSTGPSGHVKHRNSARSASDLGSPIAGLGSPDSDLRSRVSDAPQMSDLVSR